MNRDIAGLVEDKQSRHGVVGHFKRPENGHRKPEECCKKRAVAFGVAFGDHHIDCSPRVPKHLEIGLVPRVVARSKHAGGHALDVRCGEALAFGDHAGEYRALKVSLCFSERSPVQRNVGIWGVDHLLR